VIEFLRRRIRWRQNQCTTEIWENDRELFAWHCRSLEYNDALKELVPLEEPEWELHADGIRVYTNAGDGHFRSEEELKCYIIRHVYNLDEYLLIPSEILYDAGMVYVTGCWVDGWNLPGSIRVKHHSFPPPQPEKRNIRLRSKSESVREVYRESRKRRKSEPVHEDHRTSLRLMPKYVKPKPYEPLRLHKGDDMELSWQEEQEVWIADHLGAGVDEYDTLDDDECYYVLETGECDVQTCAIVTIDPKTGEGQEGPSQVQNARKTSPAGAKELHPSD